MGSSESTIKVSLELDKAQVQQVLSEVNQTASEAVHGAEAGQRQGTAPERGDAPAPVGPAAGGTQGGAAAGEAPPPIVVWHTARGGAPEEADDFDAGEYYQEPVRAGRPPKPVAAQPSAEPEDQGAPSAVESGAPPPPGNPWGKGFFGAAAYVGRSMWGGAKQGYAAHVGLDAPAPAYEDWMAKERQTREMEQDAATMLEAAKRNLRGAQRSFDPSDPTSHAGLKQAQDYHAEALAKHNVAGQHRTVTDVLLSEVLAAGGSVPDITDEDLSGAKGRMTSSEQAASKAEALAEKAESDAAKLAKKAKTQQFKTAKDRIEAEKAASQARKEAKAARRDADDRRDDAEEARKDFEDVSIHHKARRRQDEFDSHTDGGDEEEDGDDSSGKKKGLSDAERRHREILKSLKSYGGQGMGFGKSMALGFASYGLGSSIMGFFSDSAGVYSRIEPMVRQLKATFDDMGASAVSAGHGIGYMAEQSHALMNAIGSQTNEVSIDRFRQYAGFARMTGTSDMIVAEHVGKTSRLSDQKFFRTGIGGEAIDSDVGLGMARAVAKWQGMSQGRWQSGEFLQLLSQAAESQFERTGEVTPAGVYLPMTTATAVFGDTERGRGEAGLQFGQNVGKVLSGETSEAMRIYMMRALGYGTSRGMSYLDTMEQMERGMGSGKNLASFFRASKAYTAGLSPEEAELRSYQMFGDEFKKAGVNLSGFRKLMSWSATEGGRQTLAMMEKTDSAVDFNKLLEEASAQDKIGMKVGWGAAGGARTLTSEKKQVALEQAKYQVGKDTTDILYSMQNTMLELGGFFGDVFKELTGKGVLDMVKSLVRGIEDLVKEFRRDSDNPLSVAARSYRDKGYSGTVVDATDETIDTAKGMLDSYMNTTVHMLGGRSIKTKYIPPTLWPMWEAVDMIYHIKEGNEHTETPGSGGAHK